jgi:hypothetical protein
MEDKRNISDWDLLDLFFSVGLTLAIISVPFGGIEYLNGRFDTSYLFFLDACFVFPVMMLFVIVFSFLGVVQLICFWKKYTKRKKIIKILQTGVSIVFITSFIISFFTPLKPYLWQPGYKPFTYGFRERIRSEADIEDIRSWLKTLSKEDCNGKTIDLFSNHNFRKSNWPDSINWHKSLTLFNPHYVNLDLNENKNQKVRLTWGGPFGHWGFEIGMENMIIPQSDFSQFGEFRLPLEPGAYVWYELQ